MAAAPPGRADRLAHALAVRGELTEGWLVGEAARIAELCHAMAVRLARGGRLLACGADAAGRSDAQHVEVEFVHPVIVGKRALPALALEPAALGLLVEPDDVVLAFGAGAAVAGAIGEAEARGALTVAFAGELGAAWAFVAPTRDPLVAQELVETLYHVVWELVHVFFEHRGLLGAAEGTAAPPTASSFLYPFLADREDDLGAVLADVAASARAKARETQALREATLAAGRDALAAAAGALRARLDAGGRVLALGNGGSATDAADLVADLRAPPPGRGWPARPALDLSAAPAVLTAIANDVGAELVFTRQLIAHGRPGDVLVALSTSGGSANVLHALARARADGLATVALVGYDGGRILADGLADHVLVAPSEHIPRIQEAQATVLHLLREELERDG